MSAGARATDARFGPLGPAAPVTATSDAAATATATVVRATRERGKRSGLGRMLSGCHLRLSPTPCRESAPQLSRPVGSRTTADGRRPATRPYSRRDGERRARLRLLRETRRRDDRHRDRLPDPDADLHPGGVRVGCLRRAARLRAGVAPGRLAVRPTPAAALRGRVAVPAGDAY